MAGFSEGECLQVTWDSLSLRGALSRLTGQGIGLVEWWARDVSHGWDAPPLASGKEDADALSQRQPYAAAKDTQEAKEDKEGKKGK